jgi:hypothetical protein
VRADRYTSGSLTIVAFPAAALGVVVPPEPWTAETLFGWDGSIAAAVDGPMFGYCAGQPHDYASYRCGVVDYYLRDKVAGVDVPGKADTAGVGLTISVKGGTAYVGAGRAPLPEADVAFQLYPGLVIGGEVDVRPAAAGSANAERNHRVAVGVLSDGRAAFARAYLSMYDFAVALRQAGFVAAGYTDGGGSASLVTREESGGLLGSDSDDPRGRRVPSWIVARPDRVSEGGIGGVVGAIAQALGGTGATNPLAQTGATGATRATVSSTRSQIERAAPYMIVGCALVVAIGAVVLFTDDPAPEPFPRPY